MNNGDPLWLWFQTPNTHKQVVTVLYCTVIQTATNGSKKYLLGFRTYPTEEPYLGTVGREYSKNHPTTTTVLAIMTKGIFGWLNMKSNSIGARFMMLRLEVL